MAEGDHDFGLGDEVNDHLNRVFRQLPPQERRAWEILFLEEDIGISKKRHEVTKLLASHERGYRILKNTTLAIGVLGLSAFSILAGHQIVNGDLDSDTIALGLAVAPTFGGLVIFSRFVNKGHKEIKVALDELQTPDN